MAKKTSSKPRNVAGVGRRGIPGGAKSDPFPGGHGNAQKSGTSGGSGNGTKSGGA